MLPYSAVDLVRLTRLELENDLARFARRYPNGVPTTYPRRHLPFFGRKRRQS